MSDLKYSNNYEGVVRAVNDLIGAIELGPQQFGLTLHDLSSLTSGTPNTKTQVVGEDVERKALVIRNRSTVEKLDVWSGPSGSEFLLCVLQPGSVPDSGDMAVIESVKSRISISSSGVNVAFFGVEKK